MLLSSAPSQMVLPFANSGGKNSIPVPSQIGITPGAASFTDGFPPLTMQAVSAGGVPPSGLDFNGVLYDMSAVDVWTCAGGGYVYNSAFSSAIGGYPKGARVLKASAAGYWRSIVDNNATNPDTGGAGWVSDSGSSISSVYASARQSIDTGASKILYDTVEFDTQGYWQSSTKRFVAPYAGNYRLAGSTFLPSPAGQNLSIDVYKNGAMAKRCFEYPQTSDVDLSLPFSVTVALATADYLEVFMNVTQPATLVGQEGSNQAYVYAQLEYLGQ